MTATVTTAPALVGEGASARASRWTAYLIVAIGALFMLAPFWFMFVFATHSRSEIYHLPPPVWFGDDLLTNFRLLTERIPFWRNLGWSVYVALMATVLTLLFCSMAGYAFALMEFRFKKPLFGLVMATMLLPQFMNMIPMFMIMDALGWIDQQRALYVPGAASAFGIFLMRQFATSAVPKELVEAARMDGAGELRIFASIIVPLLGPILASLALFTFLGSWNDFMWPLIVLTDAHLQTLPVALASLSREHVQDSELMMAGSVVTVLPVLVLFLALQKYYIQGLLVGSVKG